MTGKNTGGVTKQSSVRVLNESAVFLNNIANTSLQQNVIKKKSQIILIVNSDSEHTAWREQKSQTPAVICNQISSAMFCYKKIPL